MTHPDRDQDLLMYAHGELSALPEASLRLHLLTCAACRTRLAAFQATSAGFAHLLRANGSRRWSAPNGALFTSAIAALLLATTILVIAGAMVLHQRQTAGPSKPPAASAPCRPDLPSDQCR